MSRHIRALTPELRRGCSTHQRLLALIVLLPLGVVALLESYLPAGQMAEMRTALTASDRVSVIAPVASLEGPRPITQSRRMPAVTPKRAGASA